MRIHSKKTGIVNGISVNSDIPLVLAELIILIYNIDIIIIIVIIVILSLLLLSLLLLLLLLKNIIITIIIIVIIIIIIRTLLAQWLFKTPCFIRV